jgi:hypothetical protein
VCLFVLIYGDDNNTSLIPYFLFFLSFFFSKVMGDDFVDGLFTIRMREEYICSSCATATTKTTSKAEDDADGDEVKFPISPDSLKSVLSDRDLMEMTGRLSPKLDIVNQVVVEEENNITIPGVVRLVSHDAPALSIAVPCLKHAASISSKGDSFSAVLRKASEMSCDVVHCKQTKKCAGRPVPCRRTLRRNQSNQSRLCPSVFALELIHDDLKARGDPIDIAQVLAIIQPKVDLNAVSSGQCNKYVEISQTYMCEINVCVCVISVLYSSGV